MEFEMSVSVSLYEVIQDHAYDLLDPKHLEVSVKSIQEFHNIYFSRGYEDSRRNIKDGIIFNESNRTKSLYTLLNVVYAVNADEKHEQTNSNITRISCRNESCNDAYMLEPFLLPRLCLLNKFSFSVTPKRQASVDRLHKQKSKFSSQSEGAFFKKKWEDTIYFLDHGKTNCLECAHVEKEG
ncbi:Maturase K [Olea europaea subsp. europaea]|uniref:Maturase K n=1 Tax=Olea europaea subsp. europaea TaxID=158383 RepID=A0A8S0PEH0_OLEEU|nr:Maturase K [Olea europaea subsp. europaea]